MPFFAADTAVPYCNGLSYDSVQDNDDFGIRRFEMTRLPMLIIYSLLNILYSNILLDSAYLIHASNKLNAHSPGK
jgi:hypothetical protein